MSQWHLSLWVLMCSALWILDCVRPLAAQVIPDNTLPAGERSQVSGNPNFQIEGGARRGGNLFHSFQSFSVPTKGSAYFNNAADVQNIFSRVTGGSISNIDGVIRANGTPNLFLLNPNGIIFGQNARLDIGGSFVASTASSLKFANGFEFNATNPQSAPLLSINVPVGLQYGVNPGAIQVKGDGQPFRLTDELIDTTDALRVPANQTLALVGGDIFLEGAILKTAGGRIELGSVGDNSLVSLTPVTKGFFLSYDGVQNFGNIQLSQLSAVDASGTGSGDIQVQGRRVSVSDGSNIQASPLGAGKGGKLVVNATELLELVGISADGYASGLFSTAYSRATEDAGNLTINTQNLLVQDGAQVSTGTFGAGKGGSLTVNANNVQLIGMSANGEVNSGLFSQTQSTGDAGNLTINTQDLLVQDGAHVSVSTYGKGKGGSLTVNANNVQIIGTFANGTSAHLLANAYSTGDGGNLTINTQHLLVRDGGQMSASTYRKGKGGSLTVNANNVQIIGTSADGEFPSGLFARTQRDATADAGNLTINTQHLLVRDGGQVSVSTFGQGSGGSLTVTANDVQLIGTSADSQFSSSLFADARSTGDAGNLTINTQHLLVRDGARVGDGTFRAGKGGSLTVIANDVQLIGTSADSRFSSGLYTQAELRSTGDAGNLTINAEKLLVQDGAKVSVSSQGQGIAGNLTINASSIRLNNNAALNANTQAVNTDPSIEQATINLHSKDLILFRGSNIITNASGENVTGGNIKIDTDVLVAFANSDISANSTDFRGGNVKIDATGIFGTQFRDALTPNSDITATGKNQQLNGTVQINTPDVNPNNGLVELPANFVDRSGLIAQGCPANKGNSFTITGRGGLPPLPTQALRTNQTATVNWVTLNPQEQRNISVGENSHLGRSKSPKLEVPQISPTIVEATGWVINKSGTVELTALTPIPTHTNTFNSAIASGGDLPIVPCPSQAAAIQK